MTRMRGFRFAVALVPVVSPTRASLGSSILALATVLALTPPAGAQVADVGRIDLLDPYPDRTGMEPSAPHELRWDERLPGVDLDPAAGAEVDFPRRRTADLADLEGIFGYRLVGEHRHSLTGYSISFSWDADCDGFSEVLIGAPGFFENRGAAYLVSMADLEAADAADGFIDRVIDLGLVARQPRSWKLVGEGRRLYVGGSVASDGDVNSDGCSDLLVGTQGRGYFTGSAYVISAFDLPAADAADGAADGVVEIRHIADQPDSWELRGEAELDNAGETVSFAGDVNGDSHSDLLIGARFYGDDDRGAAYLLSGAALAAADARDGVADGRISLASVAAQPDSWKFVGENAGDRAGNGLSSARLDADGRPDFAIAAYHHAAGLERQGAVYLIAASDLPAMDGADGALDGLIDLGKAAGGRASWKLLGDTENQYLGGGNNSLAAGDVDGDGLDEVVVSNQDWDGVDEEVFVVSVSDLPSADEADGVRDGVARLDHALTQDDSFNLEWAKAALTVSSGTDIDGDGLEDLLVGNYDFQDGPQCLPGGGYRSNGAVVLIRGGTLHAADAEDGVSDSVIDLNRVSSRAGSWKFIGESTGRLGTGMSAGDVDGDGRLDPILASHIPHTPYLACGSWMSNGYVFLMSTAGLPAVDAVDGAADGEIHLDVLRVQVDREPLVVREVMKFEDSVVVMRVSGSLKTTELDFDLLSRSFYSHYEDEFDYLIFISNLPLREFNFEHHFYYGSYMDVSNTVRGTGQPVFGSGGILKSMIHFPYRDPILYGPSLHEIMHSWANYAIPTVEPAHWGFSSANGQLGGFDLANLVDLGNGRYSAGRFGTFANGGNSLPYSPLELYFAGLIPPEEVPDLWVAKDGRWLPEEDESGNQIFTASEVETWSIQRIVEEQGARVPDWRSSQKSFRAAVVLITDDWFPATPATLAELRDALRTFSQPGSDASGHSFNFWEATGGRATLKMDELRGTGVPTLNLPPEPVGTLPPLKMLIGDPPVNVEVGAAFRDSDGDALTYTARSSAPAVAAVSVSDSRARVTAVSEGAAVLTVTATDTGGSNGAATQTFAARVRRSFTDHPLMPSATPIKAIHFTELRSRIDALLTATGAEPFAWEDPVLTAGGDAGQAAASGGAAGGARNGVSGGWAGGARLDRRGAGGGGRPPSGRCTWRSCAPR